MLPDLVREYMHICMPGNEEDAPKTFPEAVAERIRSMRLNYTKISEETGIHPSQVSRICRGKFENVSLHVVQICILLGIDPPSEQYSDAIDGAASRRLSDVFGDVSVDEIDRLIDLLHRLRVATTRTEGPDDRR